MLVNQVRSTFLNYFEKNVHKVVQSSPLIPQNDPTLMFTAAGMVQFKNYFTGIEKPEYTRAASSQKCVRAGGKHNDLENVGYTARHHTFFEMLGNFSFGDYFKEEAIKFAWDCLTKEFSLPKDKLYITVYHTDDEAFNIWKKLTGFADDKIIRIPTKDNFWAMGDVGPCGPCSEIFYDHGDKIAGGLPGTPEEDGDRYIEIWNLVFMQFEDQLGGKRISLPKPSIDTGMGLERVSSVLQGKHNNFEIDLFARIIEESKQLTGNGDLIHSHRVIADHLRAACFLIADGVMPSNEGRGYVLRRIVRRAMRHAHILGAKDALMYRLVPGLIHGMGDAYPELQRASVLITSVLKNEEERFKNMLGNGLKLLGENSGHLNKGDKLSGEVAFKLYDTFGFPLDLTADVLRAKGIGIDQQGFDEQMNQQRERAKAAWVGSGEKATDAIWFDIHAEVGATDFLGYDTTKAEGVINAIVQNGKRIDSVSSGEAIIILNQTPFYAESGGQIGDQGYINKSVVKDTAKYAAKVFGHKTEIHEELKVGQNILCEVDSLRRAKIKANHSATHLLHKALRSVLGGHVVQKGSLVAPDRLRFDFVHHQAMNAEEIAKVEEMVNGWILNNQDASTKIMSPEMAIEQGAMALFGEKYGDEVRVVTIGETLELCGGIHVRTTGEIGLFKLTSEAAIASGIRRIEAVTGYGVLDYLALKDAGVKQALAVLRCSENDIAAKLEQMVEDKKRLEKELTNLRINFALETKPDIQNIKGINVVMQKLDSIPASDLKTVLDRIKSQYKTGVFVLSSVHESKVSLIVAVSDDLKDGYKANELIKFAAEEIAGSGGGRPEFAQAGGTKVEGVQSAFSKVIKAVEGVN